MHFFDTMHLFHISVKQWFTVSQTERTTSEWAFDQWAETDTIVHWWLKMQLRHGYVELNIDSLISFLGPLNQLLVHLEVGWRVEFCSS